MSKKLSEILHEASLRWSTLRTTLLRIQGFFRDRKGHYYWRESYEYSPGHFDITLFDCSSLLSTEHQHAGWLAVGGDGDEEEWTIFDVRVDHPNYQRRGIGTALVQAAIALAQQKHIQRLEGFVTRDDAAEYPFLPAWYAKLGFTVEPQPKGDPVARFWMHLQDSDHSSKRTE